MTTQPTQDAIVTQRARDAAADLRSWLPPLAGSREVSAMRDGGLDDGAFVRAFARFQAEIESATIELCAGAGYIACAETRHVTLGDKVRTAIRNLKGQTSGDGSA